jgi:hypothetical protein
MIKINKEEKKKEIIVFLKKNPKATYRILKGAGFKHIERLFKKGLGEAFEEAGLETPRTFERKNREQRRAILIAYIRKHPKAGGQDIQKDTKINIKNAFNNIKEAFEAAGVPYPRDKFLNLRNRSKEERKRAIIEFLEKNPNSTLQEIMKKLNISLYKLFKGFSEIYELAGIKKIERTKKRGIRKRIRIIEFIKKNPVATQREINKNCKTRIQSLFKEGIFGAYKEAGIDFPYERLKLHGAAINEVKHRASNFEEEIARKLSCYGNVQRLVKTKTGKADIILEREGKKIIIEVKDYLNKEITLHEIKQLNRYLEDFNSNIGFLICHTKPKKDSFIIGKNRLIILNELELQKIPKIINSEM